MNLRIGPGGQQFSCRAHGAPGNQRDRGGTGAFGPRSLQLPAPCKLGPCDAASGGRCPEHRRSHQQLEVQNQLTIRGGWEWKRVLILVKTYPNPSTKYREIVCTAGVDESGELIRLYPIQFRSLEGHQSFAKWQFIDVRVRKARRDHRLESYEVEQESITPGQKLGTDGGWNERWAYVEHLISPSLEYIRSIDSSQRPSLCIIKPRSYDLQITKHRRPEYTREERRKLLGTLGFDTLFGDNLNRQITLEKIPMKFQYHFSCDGDCNKVHKAFFEDWEVGEAYREWRHRYPQEDQLREKLHYKFVDEPREKDNLYLILGTHSRFRETWLVIGQLRPPPIQRSTALQLSFELT